ncbi:MAG: glycosyltransferase family 2 protein [Symploca sp. SIO1C4]|uniref:Glycosyltransferase family 2 protein n=1 Tax=Symploca sp. SIO1C4 TaxID=2607765 RepID=A0A6B3NJN5_9CYAN|nr:glycosyltransferase family 2 protein [Symploca sp. SIO1C4]
MSKNSPRISIGMPVYNGERFLQEAIDSILAQTFEDFELIISDNASTDRTEEICRAYATQDQRIHYYRQQQNRGAAWNFNHIVGLARGKYFKWASYDDVCAPTFLARCVEVLDKDPTIVVCHSKTIFTKANGEKWWTGRSLANLDSWEPHVRFQAIISDFWCLEVFGLMRKDVLKTTSLIAPYYGSDRLLLLELSLRGRLKEIPEALFFRRCHRDQSSRLSQQERKTWIDTKGTGPLQFFKNRGSLRYLCAIFQAQLNRHERNRCLSTLMHYIFYSGTWKKFFVKKTPSKA